MSKALSRAIAIVGIGCRFPGHADTPQAFWEMLRVGRQAVGDIPEDRFDLPRYYGAQPQSRGKTISRQGGYLDQIDGFDADFFRVSPREAERMDPQHRLLLETAWEALENAGADVTALSGARVGIYVGQWLHDFEQRLFAHPEDLDFEMTLGGGGYAASGRIANAFGFRGPTLTIDTACSSSLYAVHLAVQSLHTGETSMALAGGVNVILGPHIHIAYSQSGMMAPDGLCKFGDEAADGYVRSEGVAVIVLKRLDDALRDGDRIYALIRGSAVNNDGGSGTSMGTPSVEGQFEVLTGALANAGLQGAEIGYVEAHGTGTRAGDRVELAALARAMGEQRPPDRPLLVGSVKTNIGHTEATAGLAGLIKTIGAFRDDFIPPSLNHSTPSSLIPWSKLPIEIVHSVQPWPKDRVRLAGVSALGISGSNAHVILEAPPPTSSAIRKAPAPLFLLSARSQEALRLRAAQVAALLTSPGAPTLSDLVQFSQCRLKALEHRAAFFAESADALCIALEAFAKGGPALAEGIADPRRGAMVAAVCPGQGGQWVGMARELMISAPAFRAIIERADEIIRAETNWSLLEQIELDEGLLGYLGARIDVVQPILAAISLAYAEALRAHGVNFDAVIGHSMGEAAAAHLAGAITLDDALRIVCRRSRLMLAKSGQGAMALVDLPRAEAGEALLGLEERVSIAAANSPRACVISGDKAVVEDLVESFQARGVFSRLVAVDVASHSPQMQEPARALEAELSNLVPQQAKILFASSLLGRLADGQELVASYWARNLRERVQFADALAVLGEAGVSAFVELGPHPTLTPAIEQTFGNGAAAAVCCGRREENERHTLLTALAQLWCAGVKIDWNAGQTAPAPVIDFPPYPWSRRRYWVEAAELRDLAAVAESAPRGPDDETRAWLHQLTWRSYEPKAPAKAGRWLVVGEAEPIAAALQERGAAVERAPLAGLESALKDVYADFVVISASGVEEAAYLPVRVEHAVAGSKTKIWFLTCGAQAPKGPADLDIDQAALWGSARVFGEEHPDIWGGVLDIPRAPTASDAATAADVLLSAEGENQSAVRDGSAFVPRLVPAPSVVGKPLRWRQDASYLLSGGLGDVGFHVARAMAKEGARRFILASRNGLPPRANWHGIDPASPVGKRVAGVLELEAMGVCVHAPALDVADKEAVRRFLDQYRAEAWPPIRGVVHLAVTLDSALMQDMTPVQFAGPLAAKLRSAQVLDACLPELDAFVLFSSVGAYLPQTGAANYAAANAGLDALAKSRQARGQHAASIAWGVWKGAGLADGDGLPANTHDLSRRGVVAFEPARAASLMSWVAGREEPDLVVAAVDWGAHAQARVSRREPLFKELAGAVSVATGAEIFALPLEERLEALTQIVRNSLAATLKMQAGEIAPNREFGAMGLTSLLSLELRNRLERALGRALPATLAWNYPTIAALAAHLSGETEAASAPAKPEPQTEPSAVSERLAAVSTISDADALSVLRQRRRKA